MSLRQVKKILQRKEEPDEESEEEEIFTKKNLFNDLEFEELDSDDENEVVEKVAVIIKNTKKSKKKQPKIPEKTEELEEILKDLENIKTSEKPESFHQNSKQNSVLKRHQKNFDYSSESFQLFQERTKNKKNFHKSGKKLALTPNVEYPNNIDYLLSMEKVPDPTKNIFYFHISKGYSKLQPVYIECIETNDANSLNQFLQKYPFHIEALYQMCMVFIMQGNYDQVFLLVERLLYSFSLSFHHQFSVISSDVEIDVTLNVYNKIFFKALSIHADCLGRKGYVRTALEVVKLILALNPVNDPTGAIFLIDYYSIRAKKFKFFFGFLKGFMKEFFGYGSALVFHNLVFSLALAKGIEDNYFELSTNDINNAKNIQSLEDCFGFSSTAVLICAVAWHPEMAKGVLKKLGQSEYKDEEIGKIAEIYANRTEEI